MNKAIHILLIVVVVTLPFIFVGSAYYFIPNFIKIYDDLLGSEPLPFLTEKVITVPLWGWLVVSVLLAILNVLNLTKIRSSALSVLSAGIMMLTSLTIVVGLFLPIRQTIIELKGWSEESEPIDADNPVSAPENPKNQLDD